MKTMDRPSLSHDAARELATQLTGSLALRGDDAYADALKIWNGAVAHEPLLFALCESAADVQACVRWARAHDVALSVRGGGHDWAGRALRHDGLVIDLSRMRQVTLDPSAKLASVGGGATGHDVTAAASAHGLAAVTPNVGAVGMAGFLLGGGYGPLTTRFGLGLDNLLAAQVVLADGRCVWADESNHTDLFWALRGGGGNFGVVTAMRVRLHAVDEVLAGVIVFPFDQATQVLRGHSELMASAPDELSVLAAMLPGPTGEVALLLGPVWSGERAAGAEHVGRLNGLGAPLLSQVGPMSYKDLLGMYDASVITGRHYALHTRWLSRLSPEAIGIITAGAATRTSPHSFIALHHFHGAGPRVAREATAFGLRRAHFMLEIGAAWDSAPPDDGVLHRRWAAEVSSALAPFALPGGYPNFLVPHQREQIDSAYGDNAQRLRELKRRLDPQNLFSSATPLPDPET